MSDEDPLPISLVAHTVFCPRRAWIEAAGETVASYNIEHGLRRHEPVDVSGKSGHRKRSVAVNSDVLGIVGVADVLEDVESGVELVEYKSTPGRRRPTVTHANRIQLALQRLCLEESGVAVAAQSVYFVDHKTRTTIDLTSDDLEQAKEFVHETRRLLKQDTPPPALVDDSRCSFCSHISLCLPDERRRGPVKRVVASDPDGDMLHLTIPGSRASIKGDRAIVTNRGEEIGSLPLARVAGVVVQGNIDVSSALMRELLWRNVTVVFCSGRGKPVGFARSTRSPNGLTRAIQHFSTLASRLDVAKELLRPKVGNQATQLRRSSRAEVSEVVAALRGLDRSMADAATIRELLGFEGRAAAIYFSAFTACIRDDTDPAFVLGWIGRRGRGATDALNVILNYQYGLLTADSIRAVLACGMDPHIGIVHSSRRNKPALALDLMEQFRPIIADSTVLTVINNGELRSTDLLNGPRGITITNDGKRVLAAAYERRMRQAITHPIYGYKVTWRRALEVQARMLMSSYEGPEPHYVGIRTR